NLSKDSVDDSYDVERVNSNSDKIDKWAGEVNTSLNALANERGYARVKRFEVETDLNALTESGVYASSKFLNSHDNNKTWKIVEVFNMSADNQIYCIQRIMGIADGGDRTFERRCNNGVWTEWIQLCYAKLQSTNFSVSEGYTATLNAIKKDSNGRCILYGIIKKTEGGAFANNEPIKIGTIPSGFIPMFAINAPIRSYRGNANQSSDPTMILLDSSNGNMTISNIVENTVEVQFTIAYDAKEV
ncbi:pyocin knob domain-containing protein, partial [Clostridium neonatale]|uniref:pyocin knob domain-containing protein n=1 Tax=Clostridium neonatale TaxID=137838 RepID=UPI00293703D6